jgi:hypothetical protein
MKKESTKVKEAQLGMSVGKVRHVLVQKLLFSLVVKTKQDICIKCHKSIKNYTELSIWH